MIDVFKRYQKGLTLNHLFPQRNKPLCGCGCAKSLSGRQQRWASKSCQDFAVATFFIVKGNTSFIRKELFKRDKGICSCCEAKTSDWESDHILPVFRGGGGCGLDNYQTLCKRCHSYKTQLYQTWYHQRTISSHAEEMCVILLLKDLGADSIDCPKVSTELHSDKCTFSSSSAT